MLGTSFMVGFIEEIPYRGFMLQKSASVSATGPPPMLTSLLFVAIRLRDGWRRA